MTGVVGRVSRVSHSVLCRAGRARCSVPDGRRAGGMGALSPTAFDYRVTFRLAREPKYCS